MFLLSLIMGVLLLYFPSKIQQFSSKPVINIEKTYNIWHTEYSRGVQLNFCLRVARTATHQFLWMKSLHFCRQNIFDAWKNISTFVLVSWPGEFYGSEKKTFVLLSPDQLLISSLWRLSVGGNTGTFVLVSPDQLLISSPLFKDSSPPSWGTTTQPF